MNCKPAGSGGPFNVTVGDGAGFFLGRLGRKVVGGLGQGLGCL